MDIKKLGRHRVSRFVIVGIFNTTLDFGILNTLVFIFGLPSIGANIISASTAATASFFLNHHFVFKVNSKKSIRQFIIFILITMVGLYVFQSLIIFVLTNHLTAPASWCFSLVDWIRPGLVSPDFVKLNFAKVVATVASLVWNYFMYARFVFKQHSDSF